MVKDYNLYLLIGQDSPSKKERLRQIRRQFLNKETEQFNLDFLYAKEFKLLDLQERLLSLPVRAKKRIIVIRQAQELEEEVKKFILDFARRPAAQILLVLDIDSTSSPNFGNEFIGPLKRYSCIFRFAEPRPLDTFALKRQLDLKSAGSALKILTQLLKTGEKPEKILGGLRYCFQKDLNHSLLMRRKMRLLLNCDLEIKTGRLKPNFALEKLLVGLCSF